MPTWQQYAHGASVGVLSSNGIKPPMEEDLSELARAEERDCSSSQGVEMGTSSSYHSNATEIFNGRLSADRAMDLLSVRNWRGLIGRVGPSNNPLPGG
jgi:hypothetical protein